MVSIYGPYITSSPSPSPFATTRRCSQSPWREYSRWHKNRVGFNDIAWPHYMSAWIPFVRVRGTYGIFPRIVMFLFPSCSIHRSRLVNQDYVRPVVSIPILQLGVEEDLLGHEMRLISRKLLHQCLSSRITLCNIQFLEIFMFPLLFVGCTVHIVFIV